MAQWRDGILYKQLKSLLADSKVVSARAAFVHTLSRRPGIYRCTFFRSDWQSYNLTYNLTSILTVDVIQCTSRGLVYLHSPWPMLTMYEFHSSD